MRHDLPSGGWIEVRDPRRVPEKMRRPVKAAIMTLARAGGLKADELSVEMIGMADVIDDLAIVALVSEWSFERPITVETVGELEGDDYDEVRRILAPHVKELMPRFDPSGVKDPKAPTAS